MSEISVYGYDPEILQIVNGTTTSIEPEMQAPTTSTLSSPPPADIASIAPPTSCPLLSLPPELRHQIFRYCLPYTTQPLTQTKPIWHRNRTSLLRTNHQIHIECMSILYGPRNPFLVLISSKDIRFEYIFTLLSGLQTSAKLLWLYSAAKRHAQRIRNWCVEIESIDDYEGMVFHGVSSVEALAMKLRGHVEKFCEAVVGKGKGEAGREGRVLVKIAFTGHRRGTGEERWRKFIIEPLMNLDKEEMSCVVVSEPEQSGKNPTSLSMP